MATTVIVSVADGGGWTMVATRRPVLIATAIPGTMLLSLLYPASCLLGYLSTNTARFAPSLLTIAS